MFHEPQAPSLRGPYVPWRSSLKEVTMVEGAGFVMHFQPANKLSNRRGALRLFRFYSHKRPDEALLFWALQELYPKTTSTVALASKVAELKQRLDLRVLA